MKGNRFHACATCIHFTAVRVDGKMIYSCGRLKYETKPHYQFNCWNPTEVVKKRMEKEQ